MSELTYPKAVVLGITQGLTEFLPVSSSAHLAIVQRLFHLDPDSPAMLLFDVLAHIGTLCAVVVVFLNPIASYFRRLKSECGATGTSSRFAWRIAGLAVIASLPTAAIGLGFKHSLEAAFDKPMWIGFDLLITGLLLASTAAVRHGKRGWRSFAWWQAVIVGTAQGIAILPGISRSGSTICLAMICGLRRRWAAEFSFFIAFPAIVGATLIKLKDTLELGREVIAGLPLGPIVVGSTVSLVVGFFALRMLLGAVRRAKLHFFAPYCWLLGVLLLMRVI